MHTSRLLESAAQWVQHFSAAEMAGFVTSVLILVVMIYREAGESRRNARIGFRDREYKRNSRLSAR